MENLQLTYLHEFRERQNFSEQKKVALEQDDVTGGANKTETMEAMSAKSNEMSLNIWKLENDKQNQIFSLLVKCQVAQGYEQGNAM